MDQPHVAVSGSGKVAVAWADFRGPDPALRLATKPGKRSGWQPIRIHEPLLQKANGTFIDSSDRTHVIARSEFHGILSHGVVKNKQLRLKRFTDHGNSASQAASVSGSGQTVNVVWSAGEDGTFAATKLPGKPIGTPRLLAGKYSFSPAVSTSANGRAVAAWVTGGFVRPWDPTYVEATYAAPDHRYCRRNPISRLRILRISGRKLQVSFRVHQTGTVRIVMKGVRGAPRIRVVRGHRFSVLRTLSPSTIRRVRQQKKVRLVAGVRFISNSGCRPYRLRQPLNLRSRATG